MLFATLFLSAVAFASAANEVPATFVAFSDDKNLQDNVARLQALTTGTPITEFCVDAAKVALKVTFLARARDATRMRSALEKRKKRFFFAFFSSVFSSFAHGCGVD